MSAPLRVALPLLLGLLLVVPPALRAEDAPATTVVSQPAAGTVHHAIIEGLKALEQGKFDEWIKSWCSKDELCRSETAIVSITRYNLPAMQRMAPFCLKGNKDALHVTKTEGDPAADAKVKVFVKCKDEGMPRPFWMIKEGGSWRFMKI